MILVTPCCAASLTWMFNKPGSSLYSLFECLKHHALSGMQGYTQRSLLKPTSACASNQGILTELEGSVQLTSLY